MNEIEKFREYCGAMCGNRKIAPTLLPTLLQLIATPVVRARFPTLSPEQMQEVAREFVRTEDGAQVKRFRRRRPA
jgi:hypothetical protein